MKQTVLTIAVTASLFFVLPQLVHAQLPEGTSERFIRVAEIGQLADSINVWGNVNSAGRYIVPEGTNLPDLISYSFGYTALQFRGSNNDFSKTQIEVKVSRYNPEDKIVNVAYFRYMYHDPEPEEMFTFNLQNNDIVSLQVRSKPTFGDYLGIVAPVVGVIATSILLIENLSQ
jgi:hypothetical protein